MFGYGSRDFVLGTCWASGGQASGRAVMVSYRLPPANLAAMLCAPYGPSVAASAWLGGLVLGIGVDDGVCIAE